MWKEVEEKPTGKQIWFIPDAPHVINTGIGKMLRIEEIAKTVKTSGKVSALFLNSQQKLQCFKALCDDAKVKCTYPKKICETRLYSSTQQVEQVLQHLPHYLEQKSCSQ